MEKILLDTDIGGDIDDAICLAYLLREPQCELLGITTVCGESEKRAAVADAICKAAGVKIPIVAGMDSTLQPIPLYPTPDGARALKNWRHDTFEKADAPAFLYKKIKENPHEIVLIGIGNMTNIATLFRTYPDAPDLLKGLYVMNGYFGLEQLPDPYYNWNAWVDPLASKIVFSSRVDTHRAIPLEVTDILTIEAEQARTLLQADSDLMKAVFDFGDAWLQSAGKLTLHDPLAAVSVFHPDICSYEKGFVQVETVQKSNMGGTSFTAAADGNVEIARTVDQVRFYRILRATLNAGTLTPSVPISLIIKRVLWHSSNKKCDKSGGAHMQKWYDEEYQFEIEVTGFLRGDHTQGYCRNGEEIGDRYTCTYGCPVNADGQGICSKVMLMLFPIMEAVRSGGDLENIGGSGKYSKDIVCPDGCVLFRLTAKKLGNENFYKGKFFESR